MNRIPDELKHPSGGERIDHASRDAIRLAHAALDRFPELMRRHKFVDGGAAVSSALVVLADAAIVRRMRHGESAQQAVASVTEDEVRHSETPRRRTRASKQASEVLAANGSAAAATNGATPATVEEPAAGAE